MRELMESLMLPLEPYRLQVQSFISFPSFRCTNNSPPPRGGVKSVGSRFFRPGMIRTYDPYMGMSLQARIAALPPLDRDRWLDAQPEWMINEMARGE